MDPHLNQTHVHTANEDILKQANEAIYKQNFELAITNKTLSVLHDLYAITMTSLDVSEVTQRIVDTVVTELNLAAAIISLIDSQAQTLTPVAITRSPQIHKALEMIGKPLNELSISMAFEGNLIINSITGKQRQITGNLLDILNPLVTQDIADQIDEIIGIKTIVIYPLFAGQKPLGALTIGLAKKVDDLSRAEKETLERLIDLVSIAIDRAALHEQVEKANQKLQILDKAKDDFVSLASHELRTPMTAIKSYTWLVANEKEGPISAKAKSHLDKVQKSTDRLISLVNELLDISRIESGRVNLTMEKFPLATLFTEVCDEFTPKAAELTIKLSCPILTNLPVINADREKIHQILENLIGNALKFTPANGSVTFGAVTKSSEVDIFVTDTGSGILPEDLPKLFQKFGRLENSLIASRGPSTGLGLFICKQYVDLHGGRIWTESTIGQGATFTFSLPL